MSTSTAPNPPPTPAEEPSPLPPLSPADFQTYNRLRQTMSHFHAHFRTSYTRLLAAATAGRRPSNLTLRQFLDEGLSLVRYLTAHHQIEETYLFPLLAKKMPEFRASGGASELLAQHKVIHEGMDAWGEWLGRCRAGEEAFEMREMRERMEGWGAVLLRHLEEEEETLSAERMRRYWSLEEMKAFPI